MLFSSSIMFLGHFFYMNLRNYDYSQVGNRRGFWKKCSNLIMGVIRKKVTFWHKSGSGQKIETAFR